MLWPWLWLRPKDEPAPGTDLATAQAEVKVAQADHDETVAKPALADSADLTKTGADPPEPPMTEGPATRPDHWPDQERPESQK